MSSPDRARAPAPSSTPRRPDTEALERLARECDVTAYRSSGPGGQKKNKTESSVRVKHRLSGITRVATESRSQWRNRRAALERLWMALAERRRVRKPRVPTRPGLGAVERRLAEKRRDSRLKRLRGSGATDAD
jgi:protein subunit release factor B